MFEALTQWKRFLLMCVEADDYEFYEILAGNESVTSWLRVYDYDGDLPRMEKSLTFTLEAFDDESDDILSSNEINLGF